MAAAPVAGMAAVSVADRVAGALWGMFVADALAMPAHWFYGGRRQVKSYFGGDLKFYEKPPHPFPDSIMALSNTGGAGRGSSDGDIIGTVINHGKKKYWMRGSGHHYHCTLDAGENTLEAEIARLCMQSMTRGPMDEQRFRGEYVEFMTRPGSHNDAYAATYHRMFFANRERGAALEKCPDNDAHNVDAIDGLIVPVLPILATLNETEGDALVQAQASVRALRRSKAVEEHLPVLMAILRSVLQGHDASDVASQVSEQIYGARPDVRAADPIVACYIGPNFQSLVHFLAKYKDFRTGVLANANAGGENVHRGIVLGAILGAQAGASNIPQDLKAGLKNSKELEREIAAFVAARVASPSQPKSEL